jgi:hypothetical protein
LLPVREPHRVSCASEGRECSAFQNCTGDINGVATTCTGDPANCQLCTAVPQCADDSPTRLTGRVITPGRSSDPDAGNQVGVPNAFVCILRNNTVSDLPAIGTGFPLPAETSGDRCSVQDLGPVLASAATNSSGEYGLEGNIPIGQQFLLVTKVGKFRRAVLHAALPTGARCTTTALPGAMPDNPTRLPRALDDGLAVNLPHVAISIGQLDAMECVFAKLGVSPSAF